MPVCYQIKEIELKKDALCKKEQQQKTSYKSIPGRPVVLSTKRYNSLQQNADKDRIHREAEEARAERKKKEAITAAIMGNVMRTPEQKIAEFRKQLEEKAAKARASLDVSKAFHEGLRQEKLARAELLVQSLKPGPRCLRSAAQQCELYRALDVQLELNKYIQGQRDKQAAIDKASCEQQSVFYIGEQKDRIEERQKAEKAFRCEMVEAIRHQERLRADNRMKQLEEEKRERAQIDAEIRAQIEKERQAIEKKRQILRKNAVEAMKMAEERKKRETMYDEVEDRLGCVYNVGRRHLEKLKAEQEKNFAIERQKQIDKNVEMLERIKEQIQNKEADRIVRDINKMKLKFDAEEQEKRNREKELKRQRIEAHIKEMEEARLAKERAEEIRRFEIAQRFKNAEVNARFYENTFWKQQQRASCVRAKLMSQEQERKRIEQEQKAKDIVCADKRGEEEDQFFFKYAHTLMEDAHMKKRPLYPFKRVINEYKKKNMSDMEESKVPRHLVTSVCCDQDYAEARTSVLPKVIGGKKPLSKVRAETLEHMAKIEAMFGEDERRRIAKSAPYCIPYDCSPGPMPQNKEIEDDCQPQPQEPTKDADCKMRYGIDELKNLYTA